MIFANSPDSWGRMLNRMEQIDLILKREEKLSEIFIGFGLIEFLVDDLKERPLGNR